MYLVLGLRPCHGELLSRVVVTIYMYRERVCNFFRDQIVCLGYFRQVYLNDLLSSGNVPDLYTKDEQLAISESLIEVVKSRGIAPEPSACWDYFIQQVRGLVDIARYIRLRL